MLAAAVAWTAVLLVRFGSVGGITDIEVTFPKILPVYVKSGSKLELVCERLGTSALKWLRAPFMSEDYQAIDSTNATGVYFTREDVNGRQVLSLMKDWATRADEGSYKCESQYLRSNPFRLEVNVLQVDELWGLSTSPGSSASIGCTVSIREPAVGVEMHWSRNGQPLDLETNPQKYNVSVSSDDSTRRLFLTVRNIGESDIGTYECNIKLNNGNNYTHDVNLYASPQVKPMGRSKNLVAGHTLELLCRAWGWPLPNISWEYEGGPLDLSDGRVTDVLGMLRIEEVAASDRAVYVCTAWNDVNGTAHKTTASILVRVKGRLAVLWPLVGIALEMFILSCIIFVYERSRARQRAEQERKEAADHQSNSNAQPHHQGRDNARFRK